MPLRIVDSAIPEHASAIPSLGLASPLSDESFDLRIRSASSSVAVVFYTEGCLRTGKLRDLVEATSWEFSAAIEFHLAHVVDAPATAFQLQIDSFPTVIIFTNGEANWRLEDATKPKLLAFLRPRFAWSSEQTMSSYEVPREGMQSSTSKKIHLQVDHRDAGV